MVHFRCNLDGLVVVHGFCDSQGGVASLTDKKGVNTAVRTTADMTDFATHFHWRCKTWKTQPASTRSSLFSDLVGIWTQVGRLTSELPNHLTSCSCCILTGLLFWSCHFEIPLCSEVGICTTQKRFFFFRTNPIRVDRQYIYFIQISIGIRNLSVFWMCKFLWFSICCYRDICVEGSTESMTFLLQKFVNFFLACETSYSPGKMVQKPWLWLNHQEYSVKRSGIWQFVR